MAGTFLQRSRHGTVWYFRRRIPDDLRPIVGHPYLVQSLRTEQRREAVIRARQLGVKTDTFFEELRTGMGKSRDTIRIDFALESFLDEFGKRTAKATDVQPGEHMDAAIAVAALQAQFDGAPLPVATTPAPREKPFGMRFEDAIEDYLSKIDVSISTKDTYRPRLAKAMSFFGADDDVRYIEKSRVAAYANHVKKTVPSYNGKRLEISQLLTLVNWMRDTYQWGADVSSRGLMPKRDTPDSQERDAFTMEQMKVLFRNAGAFREECPEKYWATLATAFLGCRVTELAQINLDQDLIQHEAGFWYIRIAITPESEGRGKVKVTKQSVKNLASWRLLPIHPALEAHGFIEFLLVQRAKGRNRRPFESKWKPAILEDKSSPDSVVGTHHHWGRPVIMWGSQEMGRLRKNGAVDDPEAKLGYFHSMRHTFSSLMVDAKIPFDVREAAIGHKYGGKDAERYAKLKENPKALLEQAFIPGLVKLSELLDEV